jgi:hypothetical protein
MEGNIAKEMQRIVVNGKNSAILHKLSKADEGYIKVDRVVYRIYTSGKDKAASTRQSPSLT